MCVQTKNGSKKDDKDLHFVQFRLLVKIRRFDEDSLCKVKRSRIQVGRSAHQCVDVVHPCRSCQRSSVALAVHMCQKVVALQRAMCRQLHPLHSNSLKEYVFTSFHLHNTHDQLLLTMTLDGAWKPTNANMDTKLRVPTVTIHPSYLCVAMYHF
jgi:hypothetical protein